MCGLLNQSETSGDEVGHQEVCNSVFGVLVPKCARRMISAGIETMNPQQHNSTSPEKKPAARKNIERNPLIPTRMEVPVEMEGLLTPCDITMGSGGFSFSDFRAPCSKS